MGCFVYLKKINSYPKSSVSGKAGLDIASYVEVKMGASNGELLSRLIYFQSNGVCFKSDRSSDFNAVEIDDFETNLSLDDFIGLTKNEFEALWNNVEYKST
ncbi:hypothetical protein [Aliikangiella coralliicola]|uniref:Uncharacterized protein n=1 Tax=Aliikangiella coralliicola TaxID=2592383 RepID=A0A545UCH6_9GAMM|nr:hypothetical protein [Aliikangiella coralliicola]TQV87160.1 hypothetical protein FLL46_15260 [Aliikangiella coralliicola]